MRSDGGLFNIVKLLVEVGADIHAETPNTGLTPLDMAEHGKKQDIIDYLTARQESYREKNKREEPSEEQDEEDDDDDDESL
ncbi:Hypp8538 [Branchiostoma lanceolatum]|uniref:Hypp8538 protein n=1 Tax=Branchiostoma lanceolatum TaxID=7740 RepID=A0A8K0EHL2_BRALA|nr:Hypp8538 [Branchiostoma lanceolatum]